MQRRRLLMMDSSKAYTVTGNPVSFDTNLAKPLRGMVIPFSPIQEGTGDPSPSNVRSISGWDGLTAWRSGKNIYNFNANNIATMINANQQERSVYHLGLSGCTLTFSGSHTGSASSYSDAVRICKIKNGSFTHNDVFLNADATVSTQTITFGNDEEAGLYLTANNATRFANFLNDYFTIQIELGSTASPYESYSGSTYPVAFPAVGKNLLDGSAFASLVASKGGTLDTTNKTIAYTGSVANSVGTVMEGFDSGVYTIIIKATSNSSTGNVNMGVVYTDNTTLAFTFTNAAETSGDTYKFITPADRTIARIYCYWISGTATVYYEDFGVFKGNVSISQFEPYTSTIYGGYVDLAQGVVVAEWGKLNVPDISFTLQAQGGFGFVQDRLSGTVVYSNILRMRSNASASIQNLGLSDVLYHPSSTSDYKARFYAYNPAYDNVSGFSEWFKTTYADGYFIYALATPQTYSLSSVIPTTLKGNNVIWTDTNGTNTVTYLKRG